MADLLANQYEIGGVVFGDRTPIQSDDIDLGSVGVRAEDRTGPGVDGAQFGIDHQDGRTLGLELWSDVGSAAEIRAAWSGLRAVWSADAVRGTARAVMPFRFRLEGSDTVVVYGRPRRWAPVSQRTRGSGLTEVVADFATADRLFYSDVEHSVDLSLVASGGGGITWPVSWPIVWAPSGARQDTVVNQGDVPTWPVITLRGPVAQPRVEVVGTSRWLHLDATIAHDQTVTIDTRPWARTVLRGDGASLAGRLHGTSLADMSFGPGQTILAYRGTDLSGQSRCTIAWRDATLTP